MLGRLAKLYETDRRKLVRVPAAFSATVNAGVVQCDVQGIDLHKEGMKVRCDMPLDVGAKVFVRMHAHRLVGFAIVRHCAEQNGMYVAGLQFCEPLSKERPGDSYGSSY
jgi:hypothetical protein